MPDAASLRALFRALRGSEPKARRHPGQIPPQRPAERVARDYFTAIRPVLKQARGALEAVTPAILDELRALRSRQNRTDAEPDAGPVRYRDLLDELRAVAVAADARVERIGSCAAGPIVALDLPGPSYVVIICDDQAAPRMIAQHGAELFAAARARGLGLRLYPCLNPDAFEGQRRANAGGPAFLEYQVRGSWRPALRPRVTFEALRRPEQTPETAAFYDDLVPWAEAHPMAAVVNLHEEDTPRRGQAFAYTFGQTTAAARLLSQSAIPLRERSVAAAGTDVACVTDCDGLVDGFHDGSVTDWAARNGVHYAIRLEVPAGEISSTIEIGRRFVLGLLDLAASGAHLDMDIGGGRAGSIGLGRAAQLGRKAGEQDARRAAVIGAQLSAASREGKRAAAMVDEAAERFAAEFRPAKLHAVVKQFGTATDIHQKKQLDQQCRAAMGIPLSALEKPHRDRLEEWAAHQVDRIVTQSDRLFDRIRLDVLDAFANATHPDTLEEEFRERYDMSERDARRIARDQVGHLQSDLNHERMKDLGVEWAIWRTANDNRVCDECFPREGVRFVLEEGIDGALPGDCHPCDRCYSEPDFSELLASL